MPAGNLSLLLDIVTQVAAVCPGVSAVMVHVAVVVPDVAAIMTKVRTIACYGSLVAGPLVAVQLRNVVMDVFAVLTNVATIMANVAAVVVKISCVAVDVIRMRQRTRAEANCSG